MNGRRKKKKKRLIQKLLLKKGISPRYREYIIEHVCPVLPSLQIHNEGLEI